MHCHPETIALIEKIKTDTFDDMVLLHSLIRDFKVRVVDPKEFKSKYAELRKNLLAFNLGRENKLAFLGIIGTAGIDFLSLKAVNAVSTYVTMSFGQRYH